MTVLPLKEYDAAGIKKIRNSIGATQALFAGILGVSKKAVEAWESGRNIPDGPSRRLIAAIEEDPHFPSKYGLAVEVFEPNETTSQAMSEFPELRTNGERFSSFKEAADTVLREEAR